MSEFTEIIFWVWIIPFTFIILSRLKRIETKLGAQKYEAQLDKLLRDIALNKSPAANPSDATYQQNAVAPKAPQPAESVAEHQPNFEADIEFDEIHDQSPAPLPPPLPPQPRLPAKPLVAPQIEVPHEPGAFELAAKGVLSRIWNWILVGEEYRKPGISVEFAVATNWLVRVGVLILVVGVGFFLDYSARMGWLGNAGKVSLAGVVGALLVGWGMFNLNKKYHLLGQGLVGAGLAILYTAMFAAHQRYELISPTMAFVGMFLVTLGAVGISIFSRSLLIAVLGIIGGYLTPFLLPDSGEILGLLVYVAFLGAGVLVISIRRQWLVLNVMAFLFTTLHMVAMLNMWHDPIPFSIAMPFVVLYFLIFSTSAFLFQVLRKEKSTWLDLGFLLMNAGAFFLSARALILQTYAREGVAIVTLFLAVFYAAHLFVFMKRKGEDKGLALCFMSLMSLFLMLTIPLYFTSQGWTLSWSLLALVLLLGSQKVNSRFLEQIAFGIFTLSLLRFVVQDTTTVYGEALREGMPIQEYLTELLRRFMQIGVPLLSLGAANWAKQHPLPPWPEFQLGEKNDGGLLIKPLPIFWIFRSILWVLIFLVFHLEVIQSFRYLYAPIVPPLLTLVWVGAGYFLLKWVREQPAVEALQFLLVSFSAALIAKWLFWDLPGWGLILDQGQFAPYSFLDAGMRLLDFLLRSGFLIYAFITFRSTVKTLGNFFGYTALGTLWIYSTLEVNSLLATFVPGLQSGGLSVFWGVFALSLVSGGLVKRQRPLRLIGLGLFCWVAVKVFFHDLASLDPIYKIVAFILLGLVLLAGAFVYVRFQDRFALASSPHTTIE